MGRRATWSLLSVAGVLGVAAVATNAFFLLAILAWLILLALALLAWVPGIGPLLLAHTRFARLPWVGRATGLAASAVLLAGSCGAFVVAGITAPPPRDAEPAATVGTDSATTVSSAAPTVSPSPLASAAARTTAAPSTPATQSASASAPAARPSGELVVHYIDVGQGDATLLQGPDFVILIDAGTHTGSEVVSYLRSVGVSAIDLLVGTHPHADHIGQFPQVLNAFRVREVWMSGDAHTTLTFERALDAIARSDAGYHEPRAGETLTLGSARLEVVNPARLSGDLHEGSIGLRVVYGDVVFLFTGDAEAATERAMVGRGHPLSATVLQLGHHGSRTSSTPEFLAAVRPSVAVWSAGALNSFGHPHPEVLARLADLRIQAYGTAINGTVRVRTDGRTITVEPSRATVSTPSTTAPVTAPPQTASPAPTPAPTAVPSDCVVGQVDINTASVDELQRIIHIGPVRANEMLTLRPFSSVDDMIRINGIGPARLVDIKAQGVACVD